LKTYIFSAIMSGGEGGCYSIAGGCFTDVMLHSSRNYHQERATEPCRLPKDVVAAWGAVILRFHGVANLHFSNLRSRVISDLWCTLSATLQKAPVMK